MEAIYKYMPNFKVMTQALIYIVRYWSVLCHMGIMNLTFSVIYIVLFHSSILHRWCVPRCTSYDNYRFKASDETVALKLIYGRTYLNDYEKKLLNQRVVWLMRLLIRRSSAVMSVSYYIESVFGLFRISSASSFAPISLFRIWTHALTFNQQQTFLYSGASLDERQ